MAEFIRAPHSTVLTDSRGYVLDSSATNIVVKLTFSGTSFTDKVSAVVERLA